MAVTVPSVPEIDSVIQSMRRSNAAIDICELSSRLKLPHGPRSPELIFFKGIGPRLIPGPIVLCCEQESVLAAAAYSEFAADHSILADTWQTAASPNVDFLNADVAPLLEALPGTFSSVNVLTVFDKQLPSRLGALTQVVQSLATDGRIKFFVHGYQHDVDSFFAELTPADSVKWFDGKTYEIELSRAQAIDFLLQLGRCASQARLLLEPAKSSLDDVRRAIVELRKSLAALGVPLLAMADVGAAPATLAAECCRQILADRRFAFLELRSRHFGETPLEVLGQLNEYFKGVARLASSETMQAVLDGRLPSGSVRPQSMLRSSHYDTYYRFRDREVLHYGLPEFAPVPYWLQFDPGAFDAGARLLAASGLVEYVLAVLRYQNPGENIRWLDIGCGSAQIMNLVRPERVGIHDFEFVGVDASEGDIEWARRQSGAANRTFYIGDAFSLPAELRQGGFHLVTMFEFIEHVEDPIGLIRAAKELSTGYVLGGSPCDELVQPVGATVHLWSFNKQGFIEIFRQAGLDVTLANQMEVGSYASGQDWLTCLGSKQRMLRDFKRSA
jgi:2-polyprenyl-3-methyl-5-hydroxy-6-metoxy-1,4-benzoquinol methylase